MKDYYVLPNPWKRKFKICKDCGKKILNRTKSAIYCKSCKIKRFKLMQNRKKNAKEVDDYLDKSKWSEVWSKAYDYGCVLFIGYGEANKGSDIAVKIAKRLRNIPFIFVGKNLQRCYTRKNISYNIWGRVPLFSGCKVLIVPSRWNEAYCRLVKEAQLSSLKIWTITSNKGGLPETCPDVIINESDNIDAWCRYITECYYRKWE